jgi:hypothetical protein
MIVFAVVGLVVLGFWIIGHPLGVIGAFIGLLLMGACTWYLPFPYDYNIPTGMLRLEGAATALGIAMAPAVIRHFLVVLAARERSVSAAAYSARAQRLP